MDPMNFLPELPQTPNPDRHAGRDPDDLAREFEPTGQSWTPTRQINPLIANGRIAPRDRRLLRWGDVPVWLKVG